MEAVKEKKKRHALNISYFPEDLQFEMKEQAAKESRETMKSVSFQELLARACREYLQRARQQG